MNSRKNAKGFTLAELIVVVAIIAILVAVSIPIFAGKTEKARESTCAANRRALKAALVNYVSDGETLAEGNISINSLPDSVGKDFDFDTFCPSGGTITIKYDGTYFDIKCSKHNKSSSFGDGDNMKDIITILKSMGTDVDSTATEGYNENQKRVIAAFAAKGLNLDDYTWSWNSKGNGYLYVTTQDISSGGNPYIIQYNSNSGNYTVWKGTIGTKNDYKYIQGNTGKPYNPDANTEQTFEKALECYNNLVNN